MTITPQVGLGALIAILILLLAILGLLKIVAFTAPFVFAMIAGLAIAYLLGTRWA